MKIVPLALAAAVAVALGSASVLAQSPNNDEAGAPQSGSQMNAPTHPGPNEWARDRDWNMRPGWQQGGYGWMGPWMMGGDRAGWMMDHHPGWMGRRNNWRRWHRHPRGAHFSFRRGDARIDIRCPANQSLKDCVDAASTLIDKVGSMRPRASAPPAPGKPKPPAGTSGSGDREPMPGGTPGGGKMLKNMPGDRM